MPQLSDRDKALLQNKIDDLHNSNQQLQDSITADQRTINNLLLLDIPSKKFLDEKHLYIYSLEEEQRLLSGKTVIAPVQEGAFQVTTVETDVNITVNDGRFTVRKGSITFVDVPIVPSRALVVSRVCGTDFEIWTRDRHGSTTSEKNVPLQYVLHSGNNELAVRIDGITVTIKIFESVFIDQQSLTVDPFVLSAKIKESLQSAGFNGAICLYNDAIRTFTVASGSSGPDSTAEVITSLVPEDLANLMKFTNDQVRVAGRYANNRLNVKIDGVQQELQLVFDIRKATTSTLGLAIDDYSADWRQDFRDGPMFPADPNNGNKIATLIQNKLREVGSGGFTGAECLYYSSSQKFIIYSGIFGITSSVEILPASDTSRDLRPFIGMDRPTDAKNNETSYDTLQDLYNYLNRQTCLQCSNLIDPTFSCYSLLIMNSVPVSNVPLYLQTTSEYDLASMSQPKLYGNKLRVDSHNDKFDLDEGTGPITKTIPHGNYSESELASALQDLLLAGSSKIYTVQYKQSTSTFIITVDNSVTMLFDTGPSKSTSIVTCMGFANFSDPPAGTRFEGSVVSFSGPDFFSMVSIPQLVPFAYLNNQPPYYMDVLVSTEPALISAESGALTAELLALNFLENQVQLYNEVYLEDWENLIQVEIQFVDHMISALNVLIATHSLISTADSDYINLVAALNSAVANRDNLLSFSHLTIMHIRAATTLFTSGYTEGGTENLQISFANPNGDAIYGRPAVEFRYLSGNLIPMKNTTLLYANNVTFAPIQQTGFVIRTDIAAYSPPLSGPFVVTDVVLTTTDSYLSIVVYWSTGSYEDVHLDFNSYPMVKTIIDALVGYTVSTRAQLWSKYQEGFVVFSGDTLSVKIGNGATQSAVVVSSPGYSESDINAATLMPRGSTLVLLIDSVIHRTITFAETTYSGVETAAMIQNLVRLLNTGNHSTQFSCSNFTCIYSGTQYFLYSGSQGTSSAINVIGGTAQSVLKLGLNEHAGTGPFSGNHFVTASQLVPILTFTGVNTVDDGGYLKFESAQKIEIIAGNLATRLGFYGNNLISDPDNDLQNVTSSSLQRVSHSIWHQDYSVLRGYQNESIYAMYDITDDVTIDGRIASANSRRNFLTTRSTQVMTRISDISSALTPSVYSERWSEVIKRLNKKSGSYYKVGEKEQGIANTQGTIASNNSKIAEMQAMLGA